LSNDDLSSIYSSALVAKDKPSLISGSGDANSISSTGFVLTNNLD
jgi:hypothetical protein